MDCYFGTAASSGSSVRYLEPVAAEFRHNKSSSQRVVIPIDPQTCSSVLCVKLSQRIKEADWHYYYSPEDLVASVGVTGVDFIGSLAWQAALEYGDFTRNNQAYTEYLRQTLFCGAAVVATESIGPVSRGERGYFIG